MSPQLYIKRPKRVLAISAMPFFLLLVTLLGIVPYHFLLAAQQQDFAIKFERLQKLTFPDITHGVSDANKRELRSIRDYFVQSGDPGARFLIGKLRAMNEDERKFLHGSDQFDIRVTEYTQLRMKQGQSNLLKYSIGFILADMFGHTSSDTQTAILRELVSSYTPSTYPDHALDYSLDRIGRPAVPYLIILADHNFQAVRCGGMDALRSLGEEAKKVSLPDAPKLDCKAPVEQRHIALNDWKAWWEKYGDKFPFPTLPSFFDLDVDGGRRGELR
jgi:hypothetical protein